MGERARADFARVALARICRAKEQEARKEFIGNEKLSLAVVSRTTHEKMQTLCPRDRLLSAEEVLRWVTVEARSENPELRERCLNLSHVQAP